MEVLLSPQAWLSAGIIFSLRVINQSLDALRIMVMMRGRRGFSWLLGFAETMIFIVVLTTVFRDLTNWLNYIAYAAGYATGNVLGMWIEERLAIGYMHMRIISPRRGSAIAEQLRSQGFGVTELSGRGRDGMVSLINCSVLRKDVERVKRIIQQVDEDAFVTAEDIRPLRRGHWRTIIK